MGKTRGTALAIAVAIIAIASMRTALATHQATHKVFSGGATFKGLVLKTEEDAIIVDEVSPSWQTIDSRGFEIPAGESQLTVVDVSSVTFCSGVDGGGACLARVRVGRTLATSQSLQPANLPIIDHSPHTAVESHAFTKGLCVRNATNSPINVSVWLQASRGSENVTDFSLRNTTFKIARYSPCTPTVNI